MPAVWGVRLLEALASESLTSDMAVKIKQCYHTRWAGRTKWFGDRPWKWLHARCFELPTRIVRSGHCQ
jgi:hypothetical protein